MAVKRRTGVCLQSPLQEDAFDKPENYQTDEAPQPVGTDYPAAGSSAVAETPEKSFNSEEVEEEEDGNDKFPAVEDDLPLGSEAHTLASEMFGTKFSSLIDKRLAMLKHVQGHAGSFDSINTSSSSINSVDMLLQERSEDPEQVLLNLGFAAGHHEMGSSVGRIPERFLLNQSHAKGINLEEFLEDNPELKTFMGSLRKKGSRSGAWKAARSMSTVLRHLKMSTSSGSKHRQQTEEQTAEGNWPKSILIPENQRALAQQGFYTQHLGFRPNNKNTPGTSATATTEDQRLLSITESSSNKPALANDAASKRKMFHRHSKKWSLVKENVETNLTSKPSEASDNFSQSLDFNYSMDFSTSTSLDSSDSPFSPDIRFCSNSDLQHETEADALQKLEDAYFPVPAEAGDGISEIRRLEVKNVFGDDGEDYEVSPPMSKQSTVERVKTMSTGSTNDESGGKDRVQIVVSQDLESVQTIDVESENKTDVVDKLNFLNIGTSYSDRLSDSESMSDYTVVDKQSTTSLESPEVCEHTCHTCGSGRKQPPNVNSVPDENENFLMFKFTKQSPGQESTGIRTPHLQDELSRMGSVQSDSSGFGDAENSVDVTPHEGDISRYLNPGSLGSSSESAATLVSNVSTILSRELLEAENYLHPSTCTSQYNRENNAVPMYSWKRILDKSDVIESHGFTQISSTPNNYSQSTLPSGKKNYVSMCYIPQLGRIKQGEQHMTSVPENDSENVHTDVPTTKRSDISIFVTGENSIERKEKVMSETRHSIRSSNVYSSTNTCKSQKKDTLSPSYASPSAYTSPSEQYSCTTVPELSHSWLRSGSNRAQYFRSQFHYGSRDSILTESDISYCSTPDSVASCNYSESMEYSKLIKLINQPVSIQGYKRSIIHYKPKRHVRDWPNLIRKKRLQEETCMLQYAIQKYKTELHSIETAFIIQFQQAYAELTDEEKDEVEELQHLWTAIHQQLLETERLLSLRMKKVTAGNDFFTFLSTLGVLQKMILLLREQLYQQQITVGKEELDTDNQPQYSLYRSQSYGGLNAPPSPFSPPGYGYNMASSGRVGQSLDELRDTLINDMREEVRKSTQNLHFDLQSKDNEIKRLHLELMMDKHRHGNLPELNVFAETDV